MTPTNFLKQYSGQSLDQLIALEASHRIDSLVLALESALDQKVAALGAGSLSAEERVILAIEALEREVNNGGYDQFFANSSRAYASEIVEALRVIGCPTHANIAKRALDALRVSGPISSESIEAAIHEEDEEMDESLDALNQEYYSCMESIEDQLFAFVKAHRTRIRLQ